jgi:hypothetical protein
VCVLQIIFHDDGFLFFLPIWHPSSLLSKDKRFDSSRFFL